MIGKLVEKVVGTKNERELKRLQPIVARINELEPEVQKLSDQELRAKTDEFKERLQKGEALDELLPEAFAVVREAGRRVLGMRHFDVQLMGGIVLHQGKIAEMKTGEGKTLVATLPVYLNALTGRGVHVVTVNDYLAKRDAEWMGNIYRFLGLSVGVIVSDMGDAERKKAYACDVTYGTNSEFGFDYLRDNMKYSFENMVQRGHHYAIVDEVDSVLIDEARTPLIISGSGLTRPEVYLEMDRIVRKLKKDVHFTVDEEEKTVVLTEEGIEHLQNLLNIENIFRPGNAPVLHLIRQGLRAHHLMRRDVDYVVKDGKVIIVDEFTGRLMPGRRWSEGLHQAVEAKEGVKIGRDSKVLASITYQNYFRMYEKLAGMTGTAETEAREFKEIYGMDVVVIPPNRPVIRVDHQDVVYVKESVKFENIVRDIEERHKKRQPVLVGTVSVEKSERLSKMLTERGIPHVVLNAKHHEKEAEIIAQAGRPGAVTVATNMAGRGVDIILGGNPERLSRYAIREKLGDGFELDEREFRRVLKTAIEGGKPSETLGTEWARIVEEAVEQWKRDREEVVNLGGLYVLGTERHESRRIDNQLRGRAGRQGDPGESRFYVSFEDDLIRFFGGTEFLTSLAEKLNVGDSPLESEAISQAIEKAQRKVEEKNFEIRKELLKYDNVMNEQRKTYYEHRKTVIHLIERGKKEDKVSFITERLEDWFRSVFLETDGSSDGSGEEAGASDGKLGRVVGLGSDDARKRLVEFFGEENVSRVLDSFVESEVEKYAGETIAEIGKKLSSLSDAELNEILRLYLKLADRYWSEHLTSLEHLRGSVALRSYAHLDPLVEYKKEAYRAFEEVFRRLSQNLGECCRAILAGGSEASFEEGVKGFLYDKLGAEAFTGLRGACPCGSGKSYRKCCGRPNRKSLTAKLKKIVRKRKTGADGSLADAR